MSIPRQRQVLSGATWLSASGYAAFILGFGVNLWLVRRLFPADFGTFAFAVSFAELMSITMAWSFSQAIIQMPEEPAVEDTAYGLTARLVGVLGVLSSAAAFVLARVHSPRLAAVFFVVVVMRLLGAITGVYAARLEREFSYRSISLARLAGACAAAAAAVAVALAGGGIWALAAREVALAVVIFVLLRAASTWRPTASVHRETARKLWTFGKQVFVARALEAIAFRGDIFVLGLIGAAQGLGFYDRGRYIAELGHYVVSFGAVQVALPVYAWLQRAPGRLTEAYRVTHYFLVRIMMVPLVWMIALPASLVEVLYGDRWASVAAVLPWLAGYGFMLPVVDNIKVLLTGTGQLKAAVSMRLAQVIVTFALLVLMVRWAGAIGAAVAMTAGQAAALVSGYLSLRQAVTGLFLRSHRAAVAAAAAAVVGAVVVRNLQLFGSTRWADVGYLGLAAVVYMLLLLLLDHSDLWTNARLVFARPRETQEMLS